MQRYETREKAKSSQYQEDLKGFFGQSRPCLGQTLLNRRRPQARQPNDVHEDSFKKAGAQAG